ncbi:unnamed protein product [Effrenium voratum]|nr:unnamed protein product [Effrenium voratum]
MAGRKRRLSHEEEENFGRCLSLPGCSDNTARAIWNIAGELREDGAAASRSSAFTTRTDLTADALACYERHELAGESGKPVPILIGVLAKLLRYAARGSPPWATVLDRVFKRDKGRRLSCVLYHDELICGNVLAVRKVKKICMIYLSFRELYASLSKEDAWLTVAAVQASVIDRIAGGMTRLMTAVVKSVHAKSHESGFVLELPSGPTWVRIRPVSLFLSDQEAQRATWSTKGSAGLKPCLFCLNVLNKGQAAASPFQTIDAHDVALFQRYSDEQYFLAAEELAETASKTRRKERETLLGVTHVQGSLLLDPAARGHLPPSSACNDVLHNYFCNGVASVEIGMLMTLADTEGIMTLETFRDMACAADWRRPGRGHSSASAELRRLLDRKMFDAELYKGQGHETARVVHVCHYYVAQSLVRSGKHAKATESFARLRDACAALRVLKHRPTPIQDRAAVRDLELAQARHQAAYVQAYGPSAVKPKHHHRLHLPESALKLGWLPSTEAHESKHRVVKGGMLDHQKARLSNSLLLQRALLGRILHAGVVSSATHGLEDWACVGPSQAAPPELRHRLGDDSLRVFTEMKLIRQHITTADVLLWPSQGGVVRQCLSGQVCGLRLRLAELRRHSDHPCGSVWRHTGREILTRPSVDAPSTIPAMWTTCDQDLICLH